MTKEEKRLQRVEWLRLIERSNDVGDGWRNVPNGHLLNSIRPTSNIGLTEIREAEGDRCGQIRMTDKGRIILEFYE